MSVPGGFLAPNAALTGIVFGILPAGQRAANPQDLAALIFGVSAQPLPTVSYINSDPFGASPLLKPFDSPFQTPTIFNFGNMGGLGGGVGNLLGGGIGGLDFGLGNGMGGFTGFF